MALALSTLLFLYSSAFATSYNDPIQNVNYSSLKRLLEKNELHSISELLPLLPESYRSRYALMFKSRSLHESSPLAPRVLLYGSDAKFIITFNGNPNQKGYAALETMEYNNDEKSFLFREILFAEDSKPNFKTTISEANPKKCLVCHGEPARPIWDTYPNWPGGYGQRYRMSMAPDESKGFQEFLKIQPTHPRYQFLTGVKEIADQNTFKNHTRMKYDGSEKPQPNAELNSLLNRLNHQWIMNELKKSPQFHFFRYALLGALDHECEDVDTLLPDRVRASFKKSLKEFSKDADTIHVQQEKAKLNRLAAPNSEKPDPLSLQLTHRFRYLVEEGLHLSTQRWSLAFEKGSTDFSSSEMDIRDLEPYLEKEISQSDDQIEKFYPSSLHADRFCDYIRKQSLMSLKDFLPIEEKKTSATLIHSMPEQNPQPALLATCIACHESGVAPRLEFSKSNQLSRLLNTKKYPRGFLIDEILFRLSSQAGPSRMPLNQVISPEEELELKNYFTKLSQESNRQ